MIVDGLPAGGEVVVYCDDPASWRAMPIAPSLAAMADALEPAHPLTLVFDAYASEVLWSRVVLVGTNDPVVSGVVDPAVAVPALIGRIDPSRRGCQVFSARHATVSWFDPSTHAVEAWGPRSPADPVSGAMRLPLGDAPRTTWAPIHVERLAMRDAGMFGMFDPAGWVPGITLVDDGGRSATWIPSAQPEQDLAALAKACAPSDPAVDGVQKLGCPLRPYAVAIPGAVVLASDAALAAEVHAATGTPWWTAADGLDRPGIVVVDRSHGLLVAADDDGDLAHALVIDRTDAALMIVGLERPAKGFEGPTPAVLAAPPGGSAQVVGAVGGVLGAAAAPADPTAPERFRTQMHGEDLYAAGDAAGALAAFEEGLASARAAHDTRDTLIALDGVARAQRKLGDLGASRDARQEAADIGRKRLADADAAGDDAGQELGDLWRETNQLSSIEAALEHVRPARAAAEESLRLARRLHEAHPDDESEAILAQALMQAGDAAFYAHDVAATRAAWTEALPLLQRHDPSNAAQVAADLDRLGESHPASDR
jgi:hypothetical protein